MNFHRHPELLDRLAASYALGTLRGGARRRFEAVARRRPLVRAAALTWQTRLSAVAELQGAVTPPPAVWTRIDNLVRAERAQQTQQTQQAVRDASNAPDASDAFDARDARHARRPPVSAPPGWLRGLAFWRALSAGGLAAAVVAVVVVAAQRERFGQEIALLQQQLQAASAMEYVAVLSDGQSQAAMLVTFKPQSRTLVLQRVGNFREGDDQSLQLWALPPAGGPRSLGVLGQDRQLRLAAAEADVREVPTLAISLEPRGGVPGAGGPTGPVLFKGPLVQKLP